MYRPATVLAVCTSLTLTAPELTLRFAPREGTRLTKVFETEIVLSYEELTSKMGGIEVPQEYLPEFEIEIEETGRIVVADTLVDLGDGRPATLVRLFETIETTHAQDFFMTPPGVEESTSSEGESELEGREIRFVWSDADEEFTASFEADPGDAALLEGLSEDMDLRAFLPESPETEEGASWSVSPLAFASVYAPGGDLSVEREDDEWADGEQLDPEGELNATLLRIVERDGARTAEIEIEGKVVLAQTHETDLANIPVAEGTGTETSTATYEVHGHLWWNLDEQCAAGMELSAEVSLEIVTYKEQDSTPEFESTMRLQGTWNARVSVARPD
jgi:hypothetical protein